MVVNSGGERIIPRGYEIKYMNVYINVGIWIRIHIRVRACVCVCVCVAYR